MMIEWTRLNELRDDVGTDALGEVMELFVQEMDDAVAGLRADATPRRIAADLHFLRGAAANIGLTEVVARCEAGEARASQGMDVPEAEVELVRAAYRDARAELVAALPRLTGTTCP